MRFIGNFHLIWVLIAVLAAFVIFADFIADVGGSDSAIPEPTRTFEPRPSPSLN